MKTLRLLLGDQLNPQHSWFKEVDTNVTYVMMEMRQETDYVRHHIQKVAGFFAAMRSFSERLKKAGHQVIYLEIGSKDNNQRLCENLTSLCSNHGFEKFEYLLPDEYRLDQQLQSIAKDLSISTEVYDTEHFLTSREEIGEFFSNKKTFIMESFYRSMRKKFDLLMEDGGPVGGQWNYDEDNRQKWDDKVEVPDDVFFENDVSDILKSIEKAGISFFGRINAKKFMWPINPEQAEQALESFCKHRLQYFGTYQDALSSEHAFLFHSRISFALNNKMLHPLQVVKRVVQEWQERKEEITLSQVEGFVRQVIGWREYMRGIYWEKMPAYETLNFFGHEEKLPDYFWSGDTKMNCLSHAINNSLDHAYAHHIQRLMVTGNFLLLAGIDPAAVDEWYLGIYIDAIQWVEITNTRGMSQFADGGIVGTKPYVSSANYINKMGDYCRNCAYQHSKKTGDDACPFNSLYWHFYDRNRELLEKNPRIGMMYRTWDRMQEDKKKQILKQAEIYLDNLNNL
jgi:deoxyribodipyrimidine photolyase-related protein